MRWAWLLLLPLCGAGALRADDQDRHGAATLEAEALAAPCAGCHRQAPSGGDGIPSLAGLTADEIATRLLAYKRDEVQGTLMNRLARGYSDAQIARLAEILGTPPR